MNRRFGWVVTVGTLLCASLAWSQTTTPQSTSSQTPFTSSDNAPSQGASSSQGAGSQTTSTTLPSSQTPFSSSSLGAWTDSGQSGPPDQQSGSGDSQGPPSGAPALPGDGSPQTGAGGPQETFKYPESLPSLSLFSDATAHTGVQLSTSVGTLVQRVNSYNYSSWQTLSLLTGGLSLGQAHNNFTWSASYTGGVNVTTGFSTSTYSTLNQAVGANVLWNFANHWQLKVKDNYFYSDDPFQPFFTYVGNPTPNNPNPTVYFPQAVIEQNQGKLDLSHRLTARDTVNFSFGEQFQRYLRVGDYYSLWNNYSYSGAAFFQHAFSARLSAGGGYQFSAIDFGHGQSRAGVQTLEGFVVYEISPQMEISGWLGPQITHNKNLIPIFCTPSGCLIEEKHDSAFNIAEGGTFKWKLRTADNFAVEVSHGVNNGGGFLGVANIYTGTVTYNRLLRRSWVLGVGLLYSNSNSVFGTGFAQYLKSWTGTVGVSRRLFNDSWNVNAYYAFIRQSQNYTGLPSVYSTSGLGVTLRYAWNFGLGR